MKLINVAVSRPVAVCMFTLAVLLFGFVSLSRLSLNLLPDLSYPTLTIRTDYLGAAPGEVEQLVTKPIEEAIGVVKGVRKVVSASKAEQSDVVLEFEWGTKMDEASLEVREKLDVLMLPLDVKRPLLLRFNPSLDPILRYGLGFTSDTKTELSADISAENLKRLRVFAEEDIKRQLESVEGVASVKIGGGLENQIQVLVDQQKADQLNIEIASIVQRLKDENVNASGGRVEDGSQEYLVRSINQFASMDDIGDILIASRQGRFIKLSDIAEISSTFKERDSVTRFDSLEGVELAIYKEGDANTIQVAKAVEQRLAKLSSLMPQQYNLIEVYDQSEFISAAIDEVKNAALLGGVLAMFILYFFLKNIWPTLIISISIPVSIIATFNLMYSYGISLNIMSLGGIALAIGLLVDNSIVVLENIDRHKKNGIESLKASAIGTSEVSMAIVASTLTTMAVFFPLVFVDGIAGQLFSDQALTVTFALAVSLVVAITLIPMLAARQKSLSKNSSLDFGAQKIPCAPKTKFAQVLYYIILPFKFCLKLIFKFLPLGIATVVFTIFTYTAKFLKLIFAPVLYAFDKSYSLIANAYEKALMQAMKVRMVVMIVILFISSGSLLLLSKIGIELIPNMSQGEFYVELTLPTGSRLISTDVLLSELSQFVQSKPLVERTYSLAGSGSLMNASPSKGADNWGKLNVVMQNRATQNDMANVQSDMRDFLSQKAGVVAKFGEPELFSFSTPLQIQLSGYNLDSLKQYGDRIVDIMSNNDRFVDVKSSLQIGNPELKIYFDHAKLAQLGLNAPDVSALVSAKVGGEVATKFSVNDRKIDVLVLNQTSQRDSMNDIKHLIINPNSSTAVTLQDVADITMSVGPSEITRVGQQRVVLISANLAYGDLGTATVTANELLNSLDLPLNLDAKVTGQSEEMEYSFNSLLMALALAVFMVYVVLASQFESFLHPFFIIFTVPLACAGSIYGLFLTSTNVSVVVFIGLIMLSGIVVNNAIVLVDRINQLRTTGVDKEVAILQAAHTRLRPILMTSLTTILGLLPMAIGVGDGSEVRTPMAITVIFGLLFASILTLFLIPVIYSFFDRKHYQVSEKVESHNENATLNAEAHYG